MAPSQPSSLRPYPTERDSLHPNSQLSYDDGRPRNTNPSMQRADTEALKHVGHWAGRTGAPTIIQGFRSQSGQKRCPEQIGPFSTPPSSVPHEQVPPSSPITNRPYHLLSIDGSLGQAGPYDHSLHPSHFHGQYSPYLHLDGSTLQSSYSNTKESHQSLPRYSERAWPASQPSGSSQMGGRTYVLGQALEVSDLSNYRQSAGYPSASIGYPDSEGIKSSDPCRYLSSRTPYPPPYNEEGYAPSTPGSRYLQPRETRCHRSCSSDTSARFPSVTMPTTSPALSTSTSSQSTSPHTLVSCMEGRVKRAHRAWIDKMSSQTSKPVCCPRQGLSLFQEGLSCLREFLHGSIPHTFDGVFALIHLAQAANTLSRHGEDTTLSDRLLDNVTRWNDAIADPDDHCRFKQTLKALQKGSSERWNVNAYSPKSAKPSRHHPHNAEETRKLWHELRKGEVIKLCMKFIEEIELVSSGVSSPEGSHLRSPSIERIGSLIIQLAKQPDGLNDPRTVNELREGMIQWVYETKRTLRDFEMVMTMILKNLLSKDSHALAISGKILATLTNQYMGTHDWRRVFYDQVFDQIQAYKPSMNSPRRFSLDPRPSTARSEDDAAGLRFTEEEGFNTQRLPSRHRRHCGTSPDDDGQDDQSGTAVPKRNQMDHDDKGYAKERRRRSSITGLTTSIPAAHLGSRDEYEVPRLRGISNPLKCEQCPAVFHGGDRLTNCKRHVREIHDGAPRVPCPYCGKTFKRQSSVKRHWKEHYPKQV